MRVTIYPDGRRKTLGAIKGNIFKKTVKKSLHLFRKLNAWGVDYGAFKHQIKNNADILWVHEKEEGRDYLTDAKTFEKKAIIRKYGRHGVQMFLPLEYWGTKDDILSADRQKELDEMF